ncbi:MAG: hypothetical protein P8X55_18010 [Desulfosarcinaceae bacterium]
MGRTDATIRFNAAKIAVGRDLKNDGPLGALNHTYRRMSPFLIFANLGIIIFKPGNDKKPWELIKG